MASSPHTSPWLSDADYAAILGGQQCTTPPAPLFRVPPGVRHFLEAGVHRLMASSGQGVLFLSCGSVEKEEDMRDLEAVRKEFDQSAYKHVGLDKWEQQRAAVGKPAVVKWLAKGARAPNRSGGIIEEFQVLKVQRLLEKEMGVQSLPIMAVRQAAGQRVTLFTTTAPHTFAAGAAVTVSGVHPSLDGTHICTGSQDASTFNVRGLPALSGWKYTGTGANGEGAATASNLLEKDETATLFHVIPCGRSGQIGSLPGADERCSHRSAPRGSDCQSTVYKSADSRSDPSQADSEEGRRSAGGMIQSPTAAAAESMAGPRPVDLIAGARGEGGGAWGGWGRWMRGNENRAAQGVAGAVATRGNDPAGVEPRAAAAEGPEGGSGAGGSGEGWGARRAEPHWRQDPMGIGGRCGDGRCQTQVPAEEGSWEDEDDGVSTGESSDGDGRTKGACQFPGSAPSGGLQLPNNFSAGSEASGSGWGNAYSVPDGPEQVVPPSFGADGCRQVLSPVSSAGVGHSAQDPTSYQTSGAQFTVNDPSFHHVGLSNGQHPQRQGHHPVSTSGEVDQGTQSFVVTRQQGEGFYYRQWQTGQLVGQGIVEQSMQAQWPAGHTESGPSGSGISERMDAGSGSEARNIYEPEGQDRVFSEQLMPFHGYMVGGQEPRIPGEGCGQVPFWSTASGGDTPPDAAAKGSVWGNTRITGSGAPYDHDANSEAGSYAGYSTSDWSVHQAPQRTTAGGTYFRQPTMPGATVMTPDTEGVASASASSCHSYSMPQATPLYGHGTSVAAHPHMSYRSGEGPSYLQEHSMQQNPQYSMAATVPGSTSPYLQSGVGWRQPQSRANRGYSSNAGYAFGNDLDGPALGAPSGPPWASERQRVVPSECSDSYRGTWPSDSSRYGTASRSSGNVKPQKTGKAYAEELWLRKQLPPNPQSTPPTQACSQQYPAPSRREYHRAAPGYQSADPVHGFEQPVAHSRAVDSGYRGRVERSVAEAWPTPSSERVQPSSHPASSGREAHRIASQHPVVDEGHGFDHAASNIREAAGGGYPAGVVPLTTPPGSSPSSVNDQQGRCYTSTQRDNYCAVPGQQSAGAVHDFRQTGPQWGRASGGGWGGRLEHSAVQQGGYSRSSRRDDLAAAPEHTVDAGYSVPTQQEQCSGVHAQREDCNVQPTIRDRSAVPRQQAAGPAHGARQPAGRLDERLADIRRGSFEQQRGRVHHEPAALHQSGSSEASEQCTKASNLGSDAGRKKVDGGPPQMTEKNVADAVNCFSGLLAKNIIEAMASAQMPRCDMRGVDAVMTELERRLPRALELRGDSVYICPEILEGAAVEGLKPMHTDDHYLGRLVSAVQTAVDRVARKYCLSAATGAVEKVVAPRGRIHSFNDSKGQMGNTTKLGGSSFGGLCPDGLLNMSKSEAAEYLVRVVDERMHRQLVSVLGERIGHKNFLFVLLQDLERDAIWDVRQASLRGAESSDCENVAGGACLGRTGAGGRAGAGRSGNGLGQDRMLGGRDCGSCADDDWGMTVGADSSQADMLGHLGASTGGELPNYEQDIIQQITRGGNHVLVGSPESTSNITAETTRNLLEHSPLAHVFFIASEVAVAKKQAESLEERGFATVEALTVKKMTREKWGAHYEQNSLQVMTAQLLLNALNQGWADWSQVCMLVLGKCHLASGDHPYAKVVESIKSNAQDRVQVLATTDVNPQDTVRMAIVNALKEELDAVILYTSELGQAATACGSGQGEGEAPARSKCEGVRWPIDRRTEDEEFKRMLGSFLQEAFEQYTSFDDLEPALAPAPATTQMMKGEMSTQVDEWAGRLIKKARECGLQAPQIEDMEAFSELLCLVNFSIGIVDEVGYELAVDDMLDSADRLEKGRHPSGWFWPAASSLRCKLECYGAGDAAEFPKIRELIQQLVKYKDAANFHGVVVTKTRHCAQHLSNTIGAIEDLGFLTTIIFCGHNKVKQRCRLDASLAKGLTKTQQAKRLDDFKSASHCLLFAPGAKELESVHVVHIDLAVVHSSIDMEDWRRKEPRVAKVVALMEEKG